MDRSPTMDGGRDIGVGDPGEAEIEDLHRGLPAPVVALVDRTSIRSGTMMLDGLEIAVDDAALVGVVDRVADGEKSRRRSASSWAVDRLWSRLEPAVQGLAADQLHGEEVVTVVGVSGLVDGGDVGVLEAGQGLDLALEHPGVVVVDQVPLRMTLSATRRLGCCCSAS